MIDNDPQWKSWKFTMNIRSGGSIKLTVLHVALILRSMEMINFILDKKDIKDYVQIKVQKSDESLGNTRTDMFEDDDWIYGATSVHLAARFFHHCLPKVLKFDDQAVNDQTNEADFSPLHVSSIADMHLGSRILMKFGARADAEDKYGRTPLHHAAMNANYLDVVTLVEEGGADIFKKDHEGKAPYNVAKGSDAMKFFYSKMTAENLSVADPEFKLYDEVLTKHPSLIEHFLNIFISSTSQDLEAVGNTFKYDYSLFVRGDKKTKVSYNLMKRHLDLIDANKSDLLLHPLMRSFTDIKWRQYLSLFYFNMLTVFGFLTFFTWYSFVYVDICQCLPINDDSETCAQAFQGIFICVLDNLEYKQLLSTQPGSVLLCSDYLTRCRKKSWRSGPINDTNHRFDSILNCLNDETGQLDSSASDKVKRGLNKYEAFKIITIVFLGCLVMFEMAEMIKKAYKKRFRSYISWQNFLELGIIVATTILLIKAPSDIDLAGHLSGWIAFFAWFNFTFYIGRVFRFGKAFYTTYYVTKEITKTMIIFIPSLVGFTCAFHIFLSGNDQFMEFGRSVFKVLVMLLGEYDYEDNFNYDKVDEYGGRNTSLQLIFVLFTLYGSVIIMNLLVAMFVNQLNMEEAEALLYVHKVEEISDVTDWYEWSQVFKWIFSICISKEEVTNHPDVERAASKTSKSINVLQP